MVDINKVQARGAKLLVALKDGKIDEKEQTALKTAGFTDPQIALFANGNNTTLTLEQAKQLGLNINFLNLADKEMVAENAKGNGQLTVAELTYAAQVVDEVAETFGQDYEKLFAGYNAENAIFKDVNLEAVKGAVKQLAQNSWTTGQINTALMTSQPMIISLGATATIDQIYGLLNPAQGSGGDVYEDTPTISLDLLNRVADAEKAAREIVDTENKTLSENGLQRLNKFAGTLRGLTDKPELFFEKYPELVERAPHLVNQQEVRELCFDAYIKAGAYGKAKEKAMEMQIGGQRDQKLVTLFSVYLNENRYAEAFEAANLITESRAKDTVLSTFVNACNKAAKEGKGIDYDLVLKALTLMTDVQKESVRDFVMVCIQDGTPTQLEKATKAAKMSTTEKNKLLIEIVQKYLENRTDDAVRQTARKVLGDIDKGTKVNPRETIRQSLMVNGQTINEPIDFEAYRDLVEKDLRVPFAVLVEKEKVFPQGGEPRLDRAENAVNELFKIINNTEQVNGLPKYNDEQKAHAMLVVAQILQAKGKDEGITFDEKVNKSSGYNCYLLMARMARTSAQVFERLAQNNKSTPAANKADIDYYKKMRDSAYSIIAQTIYDSADIWESEIGRGREKKPFTTREMADDTPRVRIGKRIAYAFRKLGKYIDQIQGAKLIAHGDMGNKQMTWEAARFSFDMFKEEQLLDKEYSINAEQVKKNDVIDGLQGFPVKVEEKKPGKKAKKVPAAVADTKKHPIKTRPNEAPLADKPKLNSKRARLLK